ncbi:MAG TPA: DUF72 domain-containing protein [Gaiellaceae bacterium]|nr:DUF72 domain-containing protein [Gaiellaceae bacterium]
MSVRVGTSGWNYKSWRGTFYPRGVPARRWLEHYATIFDAVEVNATFYRLPKPGVPRSWADQTPDGFVFAVKGSRYLTHIKRLNDTTGGVERFFGAVEGLAAAGKLGPVLWQLPPNFRRDDERLSSFLDGLPAWRHCVELRHESWFAEDVYALLRERDVALVAADDPRMPFQTRRRTAGWMYARLHHGDRPDGDYSDRALAAWRRRLAAWSADGDVYAYFNNDWAIGRSEQNADRYRRFARRA